MNGVREHLLVIRLSAMGDVAMIVPVLLALMESNPELKITVVTKETFVPIFTGLPNVYTFAVFTSGRHKGVLGIWRLSNDLLKLNPTAIADLHNVLRTSLLRLFLSRSRIPFVFLDKNRKAKRKLTQKSNKVWEPLTPVFSKYEEVFRKLGFKSDVFSKQYQLPRLILSDNLGLVHDDNQRIKIGIAPFAAHSGKCYPENLMEQVIDGISKKLSCTILLFGGGKEETDKLTKWENKYSNCISLAGRGTLRNELAVISNLNLMLSMDSGNGHLAAMYGIPVITLWGVTHPYAGFAPYFQAKENSITADRKLYPEIPTSIYGNRVPKGYEFAMNTIVPEQVVCRVLQTLKIKHSL